MIHIDSHQAHADENFGEARVFAQRQFKSDPLRRAINSVAVFVLSVHSVQLGTEKPVPSFCAISARHSQSSGDLPYTSVMSDFREFPIQYLSRLAGQLFGRRNELR